MKIELELPAADFPYGAPRLEFNKYLENWYNRHPTPGAESLTLVSYAFWKEVFPEVIIHASENKTTEVRPVSTKIQQEVFAHLSSLTGRPASDLTRTMHLSHELGLDSLDVAGLYIFLDERFLVKDLVPGEIQTVEDLLQAAAGYKKKE